MVKKALITGITGQDGSYLSEFLLEKGYEVYGIVRKESSSNAEKTDSLVYDLEHKKKLNLIYGDLTDGNSISQRIKEIQPDEIYNLAAQSNVKLSFDIPEYTSEVVALGTLRILEAVRNFCPHAKFYQASSSEMFGKTSESLKKETTPFDPQSPYGISKAFAYWITKNYREKYGLFVCNGILFNHESPRRGKEFVTKKIAESLTRIKYGLQDCLFIGNLDAKRDWGFAGDYVEAMWLMLQQNTPEDYVIGAGETHSVREFIEESLRILGIAAEPNGKEGLNEEYIKKESGKTIIKVDPKYYQNKEEGVSIGDSSKAKTKLGWQPKTSFKELVKMMVDYEEDLIKKNLRYSEKEIKLMEDSITKEEIIAVNKCLESGMYTQGHLVEKFEKKFAEWNGSKYSVMVNSGSSANLLIISVLKEKFNLKEGDEILVPNVTWPTTIYPVIQNGMIPVFCDVDESFNMDVESIKRMIGKNTKAIFVVHLLGQPARIQEIKKICEEYKLLLVEDCCESLGSNQGGIKVGNLGVMGSFSFYFGHHMTTIEGGMITTNDFEIYDLLKSLRSHGWIKGTSRENNYPEFKNKNFVFDTLGYNFRSTNLNAAIGLVQLEKIDEFITKRIKNHEYFLKKIERLPITPQKVHINETSSFSLGIILPDKYQREYLLEYLPKKGIECRPVVAGNLLKQPIFSKMNLKKDSEIMANKIHYQGLYLPNNQFVDIEKIDYMVDTIEKLLNELKFAKEIQRWI
ncbi:MAG: GDP-mannose 4,6-dehydratase [Nanoarchaeota archaeon]